MSEYESDCSDCESVDFEHCNFAPGGMLPFDPSALQNIILAVSDRFDFRVVMSDGRAKNALMVTTGLAVAGSMIGKHYGGNLGAALGGAVGGACGIGIVVVSMRDIWEDVKAKLSELFDVAYDYIAGLGFKDYRAAAEFLLSNTNVASSDFASILINIASTLLKKKVFAAIN